MRRMQSMTVTGERCCNEYRNCWFAFYIWQVNRRDGEYEITSSIQLPLASTNTSRTSLISTWLLLLTQFNYKYKCPQYSFAQLQGLHPPDFFAFPIFRFHKHVRWPDSTPNSSSILELKSVRLLKLPLGRFFTDWTPLIAAAIGFGTWQDKDEQEEAVAEALKAGYRHIDTARM